MREMSDIGVVALMRDRRDREIGTRQQDLSLPNTGHQGMRRALVNHYMSAESLLPWFPPSAHEAMGMLDHRDVCLVAGADPTPRRGP
jgi:hypothetical protein